MFSLSGKKLLLIGFVVFLLLAIPITIYILQKQQQTQSSAAKATVLSIKSPIPGQTSSREAPLTKGVGDTFDLDVMINPGTNQVIATTLNIKYDPAILEAQSAEPTVALPQIIEGPTIANGTISVTMAAGIDLTKVVTTTTKIATIKFKTLAATTGVPTEISFTDETNVTSTVDDPEQDGVLSSTIPGFVLVNAGGVSPTPSPTIIATITPIPTIIGGSPVPNVPPVCNSLTIDREATGSAPFSIALTANGTDTDGTISKITFNFGDGPVQDVTIGGGIGTNSVSTQIAHTYRNPGTFKASAVLTDDRNGTSVPSSCEQTITVTQPVVTQAPIGQPIAAPPPVVVTENPTPVPSITDSGPGDTIIKFGAAGAVLSVLGGLLFFAL